MDNNLERWRKDTPAADAGRIHLNNAGAALMPAPVIAAIEDHLAREVAMGGYEAGDAAQSEIGEAYQAIARLIGAQARNVAVVENATVAIAQALSAFDFAAGRTSSCTCRWPNDRASRWCVRTICRRAAWIRSACAR
jgi:selenocysteine lyase/cysteine desulfurase